MALVCVCRGYFTSLFAFEEQGGRAADETDCRGRNRNYRHPLAATPSLYGCRPGDAALRALRMRQECLHTNGCGCLCSSRAYFLALRPKISSLETTGSCSRLFKRLSYNAHRARVHPSLASKYSCKLEQETGTDAVLAKPLPKALFSISHRLWKTTCFPVPVPVDLQASNHVRLARARTPTRSPRRSGDGRLGAVQIFV